MKLSRNDISHLIMQLPSIQMREGRNDIRGEKLKKNLTELLSSNSDVTIFEIKGCEE